MRPTIKYQRKSVYILLVALSACLLCSCATQGPSATAKLEDVLVKQDQNNKQVNDLNEKFFASVNDSPKQDDYILGQGDLVQVTVIEASELTATARIGARGTITLPLIGPVAVKGLSARAAEQKIEGLYKQRYIVDPHVNIFVKEQQGAKVTVLGSVKKPGTYDLPRRRHLMGVLAMAEGLDDKAGKIVQIKRAVAGDGKPNTFVVDMEDLVKDGHSELNLEIEEGDVVYIPEAGTVYVDGAVQKPGNYPIRRSMSVQEAIAAAGGVTSTADRSKIKLVRYLGEGKRDIVEIDGSNALSQTAATLKLSDRDVVYVENDALRHMLYGMTFSFMGYGIGYTPPTR